MFKKLILVLIIIIVLGLGGLSAYVSTIDWNMHKAKIAEQLENITGKKIVFSGEVNLAFLPHPYLTAENIKIYNHNEDSTTEPLAIIQKMVTDLKLMPLLKGKFEIDNMVLQDAQVVVEFIPDGKLNWYSEISDFQRDTIDGIEIALNSVMLKNAEVNVINSNLDMNIILQNLNAEVTAESLYGPYRIDGNFVKDGNPAGFALSIGTLSESFGTSLNLVLTHPTSESYARFDGKVLSGNTEINGNFMAESKNPAAFINEFSNQTIVPTEFNYPFSGYVELKVNPQQIDLSGLVIKYGDKTAGAGNLLIPLKSNKDEEKRCIEFGFEMTELDLAPIVGVIRQQLQKYDNNKIPFEPYFDFDLIADLKAVKVDYNNGTIRNLDVSFDLINDVLNIKNLSGLLPGDTDITLKGDVFEKEKKLSYDFKVNALSQDFLKFLEWIHFKPQTYAPSTYRGAQADMKISGTLNQIKIAPLSFSIDNNVAEGVIGIVRDKRPQLFISLKSEKVNFDNYLPQLTDEQKKLSFAEKIKLTLNRLDYLNNYDVQLDTKLNVGIYHKIPFENLELNLNSLNGDVTINKFHVDNIAEASLDFKGILSGLGTNPAVENLKYSFLTSNFASFKNKFDIPLPQWPLIANAKKVNAQGIVTGNFDMATIKAVTSLDDNFFKSVYSGKLFKQDEKLNFRGRLEFNTEFVKFVNSLGMNYKPKNLPASIFTFKGNVSGNAQNWSAQDINSFISSNNFKGGFNVEFVNEHPKITANLVTNRFEFDRLIYNPIPQSQNLINRKDTQVDFLEKPLFNSTIIDYAFYNTFDLNGKFEAAILNYAAEELSDVSANVVINNGIIKVNDFKGTIGRGIGKKYPLTSSFELNVTKDPTIKGVIQLPDFDVDVFGGKKYSVKGGNLKARFDFDTLAHSELGFIENLNGKLAFDIADTTFYGWNLNAIEQDLAQRDNSEGLQDMVSKFLESGNTKFGLIGSEIEFKKGAYSFKDIFFSTNIASVEANGSGNIKNWDGDIKFKLTFDNIKEKVLPINFTWKGSLSSPSMSVNVADIKEKYDAYWAKIAKEKEEAEKKRIEELNNAMKQVQEIVTYLTETAKNDILPLIEKYKPLSANAEVKSVYDSNHLLLIDIQNQLENMAQKTKADFTLDDIADMNSKLKVFEPQLVEILREVNENIKKDTKIHAGEAYKIIINIYDNSIEKSANYQKTLNAYVLRLLQLNSLVILDHDPRVQDYKNDIETSIKTIEDFRAQANNTKNIIADSESIDEINLKNQIMKELQQKSENELEKLNTSLEQLFDYAQQLVRKEEKAIQAPATKLPTDKVKDLLETNTIETTEEPDATDTEQKDISEPTSNQETTNQNEVSEHLVVKEDIISTQNAKEPQLQPQPTPIQEEVKTEETKLLEPEPQVKEKLVKPISSNVGGIVTYSGKVATSGTVTKSSRTRFNLPADKNLPQKSGLLKPISGDKIEAEGTLNKKK